MTPAQITHIVTDARRLGATVTECYVHPVTLERLGRRARQAALAAVHALGLELVVTRKAEVGTWYFSDVRARDDDHDETKEEEP